MVCEETVNEKFVIFLDNQWRKKKPMGLYFVHQLRVTLSHKYPAAQIYSPLVNKRLNTHLHTIIKFQ